MLSNQPVVAFLATRHTDKARDFYEQKLGLRLLTEDPFALVFAVGDTTLRIQKVEDHAPPQHTLLGWKVSQIVETILWLQGRGVRMERYGFMQQDDRGVWVSPSGAKVAWFKDPDGNTLSLTEV